MSLAELASALNHLLDRQASYNELMSLRENRERIFTAMRVAESRTVTDAQRERIYKRLELQMHRVTATQLGNDILAILEEQPAGESLEGNL